MFAEPHTSPEETTEPILVKFAMNTRWMVTNIFTDHFSEFRLLHEIWAPYGIIQGPKMVKEIGTMRARCRNKKRVGQIICNHAIRVGLAVSSGVCGSKMDISILNSCNTCTAFYFRR